VCGSRAWYASRTTVFEKLMFVLGLWKRPKFKDLVQKDALLGGPVDAITSAWNKAGQKDKGNE